MTDAIAIATEHCLQALNTRPAGLLTDIDGTISQIAPTPDSAIVDQLAKESLVTFAERLDVVGVITGRAAASAEQMIGIPRLIYIGNHGLERRREGVTEIDSDAVFAVGAISEALTEIRKESVVEGVIEGVLFENKGITGSIHYRLAPDQTAARDRLFPIVYRAAAARGLRVSEGRMVIELRPALAINKGTALRSVVERCGLRGLVFLGDDVTDIDAFRVVADLRSEGRLTGVSIAIVAPESLPEVAAAADLVLEGVASCVTLLGQVAVGLREKQS